MSLKKLFDNARAASEERAWIRGILGNTEGTVAVPGQPGVYYVRMSTEGTQSVTTAKTLGRVAARLDLPVRMKRENNIYVIHDVDPAYAATATADDPPNTSGVGVHNHRRGTGLEYEVEALQLEPGRVRWVSGLNVYINAFRYYTGTWETWEGGNFNLAAYKPSTSGHWAWVLVGIDPDTNTAIAVAGTSQTYATALTIGQIDSIAFSNYIPLVAIKLRNDQTSLADLTIYQDAHEWFGHGVDFDDSEGDPAAVVTTTAADGVSSNAARRDHVHNLADGAVTLAKMADLTSVKVIGHYTTGPSAPEVMILGSGLDATTQPGTLNVGFGGDVVKFPMVGVTEIAAGAVTDVELRPSNELSVIGNPTGGIDQPTDIQATTLSNTVLMEQGDALVWDNIRNDNIGDGEIGNAKLVDVSSKTLKGRTAAGTGPVSDLTMAEVGAMLGGVLYTDSVGAGNLSIGEDPLSTYTIAADQTPGSGTVWFEAVGIYAANGFSKRIRVYYGTDLIFDFTTTASGGAWLAKGRVVVVGTSAQRAHVAFSDSAGSADLQYTDCIQDTTDPVTFLVTGEATGTDDIDLKTLVLGWTK